MCPYAGYTMGTGSTAPELSGFARHTIGSSYSKYIDTIVMFVLIITVPICRNIYDYDYDYEWTSTSPYARVPSLWL